jgi:small GTP-binding protein
MTWQRHIIELVVDVPLKVWSDASEKVCVGGKVPDGFHRTFPLMPGSPLEFKVVVIGAVSVGKTSITNRLQYSQFEEEYQPTVGAGYVAHRANYRGQDVELQIWDTAGMERYRSLGPIYYRDALAAIVVYAQDDQQSASALTKWLDAFRATVKGEAYVAIVGNKDDLEEKIVSAEPIRQWAAENGFDFFLTSAKTGVGVTELFEAVIQHLVKDIAMEAKPSARSDPVPSAPAGPAGPLGPCCRV